LSAFGIMTPASGFSFPKERVLPEEVRIDRVLGSSFRLPARLYTLDDKGVHPPRLRHIPDEEHPERDFPDGDKILTVGEALVPYKCSR